MAAENRSKLLEALGPDRLFMLDYARHAPSGHNAQPWEVRALDGDRWLLGSARRRWVPAIDPDNRELAISLGAFLETLAEAGLARGIDIDIRSIGESAKARDIAEIALRPTYAREGNLDAVVRRRTWRGAFSARAIESDDAEALRSLAGGVHFFPKGSPEADCLVAATIDANRAQAARDPVQRELADWIRWRRSKDPAEQTGLTPAGLCMAWPARIAAGLFFSKRTVMSAFFRNQGVKLAERQAVNAAGWFIVTGQGRTVAELLDLGRRLQRLWLGGVPRGIALQPMSQVLEEAGFAEAIGPQLGLSGRPQMVLRAGYREPYPQPVSPRLALEQFVTLG